MIQTRTPGGLRQFRSLMLLWWRHIRRRPLRVGESPKLAGTPTFLLINVLSAGYLAMIMWQSVARNVEHDPSSFVWHALGIALLGFASGMTRGTGRLQVRGTRNDAFLDALPLRTSARLGLSFADTFTMLPLTASGTLAALGVRGAPDAPFALVAACLGPLSFATSFVAGSAAIAWGRALGRPTAGRWGGYAGLGLSIAAMLVMFLPIDGFPVAPEDSLRARLARLWIGPDPALHYLYASCFVLLALGYRTLRAAERFGFDQLDPPIRTPKPRARFLDRIALERVMMLREGGRAMLFVYALIGPLALLLLALQLTDRAPAGLQLFAAGFVIYLAAIQTIGQAGRAARSDQQARPFLAGLPLSPHQVLEGKTRAQRLLLAPALALLLLIAVASAVFADAEYTYRIVLSMAALVVLAEGAVCVAFLSTGIGVLGVGGAQTTTGFSTQVLMLPLFATVLAPNDWAATTAFVAVAAVTFESRRAARLNVRWLDDPADDVERETTVWRALLAASAFFAMQALSYQTLILFDLPMGYALAVAFAFSATLLALLTFRNSARMVSRPRFLPHRFWYWPLGLVAGTGSGVLAHGFAELLPAPAAPLQDAEFGRGELIALGVMTTVIAPLVEEYFFRGWLQRAIEADLPARAKRWAFAIGASAFALAHLGSYGVPQLVLGLIAGYLFARGGGLWPSILAHAMHNAVVLVLVA